MDIKNLVNYICHQGDNPLLFCLRCTGIYSGFFLGVISFVWCIRKKKLTLPSTSVMLFVAIILSFTGLDLANKSINMYTPNPKLAFILGTFFGMAVSIPVISAFYFFLKFDVSNMQYFYLKHITAFIIAPVLLIIITLPQNDISNVLLVISSILGFLSIIFFIIGSCIALIFSIVHFPSVVILNETKWSEGSRKMTAMGNDQNK